MPTASQLKDYAARVNEEFDAFVVPLANAFRADFKPHLDRLTALIERLRIPGVVVGVGAQLSIDGGLTTGIEDSVEAFMRAVLERSASIGVRGDVTEKYLDHLGFEESGRIGEVEASLPKAGFALRVVPVELHAYIYA